MADRTTKLLLLAIAVGLWMNVVGQWVRPVPLQAADEIIRSQDYLIQSIASDVGRIQRGTCLNSKIC